MLGDPDCVTLFNAYEDSVLDARFLTGYGGGCATIGGKSGNPGVTGSAGGDAGPNEAYTSPDVDDLR